MHGDPPTEAKADCLAKACLDRLSGIPGGRYADSLNPPPSGIALSYQIPEQML
jgi:hypothetical protein